MTSDKLAPTDRIAPLKGAVLGLIIGTLLWGTVMIMWYFMR